MMLEQSLISPNFLGKESFRWFIGKVTEYRKIQDSNVGGGYKAKVRIVGYHPDLQSVIKDEELPWAHVLVPLSMGCGNSGNTAGTIASGGETVIGFFLDGDNAQQPVIIGGLFSGYDVDHTNTFEQGTDKFNTFQRKTSVFNENNVNSETGKATDSKTNAVLIPNPRGELPVGLESTGTTTKQSVGQQKTDIGGKAGTVVVSNVQVCDRSDSVFGKIVKALKQFLLTVQQITNGFINPALNAINNISALVGQVTTVLTDLFSKFILKAKNLVLGQIYSALEGIISRLLPKDIKLFKQLATDKVVDAIQCAFLKVIKQLAEFFTNFLLQLADSAISVPLCAVEALVGSTLSSVAATINEAIGPALQEFTSQVGGVIGSINGYISQALSYLDAAANFLTCDSVQCKVVYDYSVSVGWIPPETVTNFQSALNYPSNAISNASQSATNLINGLGGKDAPTIPSELSGSIPLDCNIASLDCGPPEIIFFGGGGSGAAGEAIIDSFNQLIGVNIINPGSGYSQAPYVSIQDACNNGLGAQATAGIGTTGGVTQVIITNPGSGYLGPIKTDKDPCDVNPVTSSGSEVTGFIVGVSIIRNGIGYKSTDLITNTICSSDVEIYPVVDDRGRIIDVNIVNPGTAIRIFPELSINTESGEGAILKPILSFKPIELTTPETNREKVQRVVLCAENHG
jgi:hypothetical protein